MDSIIQDKNNKQCIICGAYSGLESHHCLLGKNRKKAEEDGLKVWLCYYHHRGTNGVHGKNGNALQEHLKQIAEKTWIKYYNKTVEDFIERYGKNYL